jgi:hypothetical protein
MQWSAFEPLPTSEVSLSKVQVALAHVSEIGLLLFQEHSGNWIAMRCHRPNLPFQLRCTL